MISGSVGAGHDGAAAELAARLRAAGVDVDVRDYLQALPRPWPLLLREGYTTSVGRAPAAFQWLFEALEGRPLVLGALTALCRSASGQVARWTRERPYSAVVSTYPLASQTLGALRERGAIAVPVVSYLTDPAAHRTWVHAGVDHHWTVTAATAAQGSADYGLPMRAVGPLVPERFTAADPVRRAAVRARLGIDPAARVALLVAGSLGLGDVDDSARAISAAGLVPLVLCGRNAGLVAQLASVPGAVALGWRDDVHELLDAADVLVHNAGGLSFTEALVAGLPAVSYRCIPGHGLANADVLARAGLAAWARSDDELAGLLEAAADRGRASVVHDDPARHVLDLISRPARALSLVPAPRAERRREVVGRAGRGVVRAATQRSAGAVLVGAASAGAASVRAGSGRSGRSSGSGGLGRSARVSPARSRSLGA